jgi:hypothetical protein
MVRAGSAPHLAGQHLEHEQHFRCAGDGGNIEGVYKQFAGVNCNCPAGTSASICPCANVTINTAPQYCQDLRVFNPGAAATFAPVNGTQPA